MWGPSLAPLRPALSPLLPPPFQDLVLINLHRAGVLGLRGGSSGAQVGAQVPTKFVLGLVGHGAPGGTASVPFPPAPQGPFCCHHLFLPGRGWDRGVDPLPAGAPRAEGVLFQKQAGTRLGVQGGQRGGLEFLLQARLALHPWGCSSQSCIATVLGLSFLLRDEKNLFSLFLSVSWGRSVQQEPGWALPWPCIMSPTPWGEQDSVPSPALHQLLGLFPLGFLSLWDYPGQLLAGEQEGFLLSQVPPLCLFLPHLKGQQQVKISCGKAL